MLRFNSLMLIPLLFGAALFYCSTASTILPKIGNAEYIEYKDDEGRVISAGYLKSGNCRVGHWNFYKEGKLEDNEHYQDCQLHGVAESFLTNGTVVVRRQYKSGKLHGPLHYFDRDGALLVERNYWRGYQNGETKTFDKQGTVDCIETFEMGNQMSAKCVTGRRYLANGNLWYSVELKKGIPEGEWRYWYSYGPISNIYIYNQGLRDGNSKHYHGNKKLEADRSWSKGKRDGLWTEYDAEGRLVSKKQYFSGEWHSFSEYEDGKLIKKTEFRDTKRTLAVVTRYAKNGQLLSTVEYKDKLPHGRYEHFFANSQRQYIGEGSFGFKTGLWTVFYMNGNIRAKGMFDSANKKAEPRSRINSNFASILNSLKTGTWKYYYPNGSLMSKVSFRKGLRHGLTEEFFPNGLLRVKEYYIDGVLQWANHYEVCSSVGGKLVSNSQDCPAVRLVYDLRGKSHSRSYYPSSHKLAGQEEPKATVNNPFEGKEETPTE